MLWVDPLDQRRLTRPLDHRGRQQPPPATPRPSDPVEARDGADTLTEDERAQRIKEALAREPEFSVLEHHYGAIGQKVCLAEGCFGRSAQVFAV